MNSLWNILTMFYFYEGYKDIAVSDRNDLFVSIWRDFFKEPTDEMPYKEYEVTKDLKRRFYDFDWTTVYDFLEFVASIGNYKVKFQKECNNILKREFAAYRFIEGKILRITSKNEIQEIIEAINSSSKPVHGHLTTALDMLSDRTSPNYRNSIKESISAVEAICQKIAGKNATLGDALGIIANKIALPPPLRTAFEKIYGYTNSSDGIRHALSDVSTVEFEDAKFMLVSCSAFVNYLLAKQSKNGK